MLYGENVFAHMFPDNAKIINNTDYGFTVSNLLSGEEIYLPAHSQLLTFLQNDDDKKFTVNCYITAEGTVNPSPKNTIALFLQTTINNKNVWITEKTDNYPSNYPNPGSQIYCDEQNHVVCGMSYYSTTGTGDYFVANIYQLR